MAIKKKKPAEPVYTYDDVETAPAWDGLPVTARQVRRWCEAGRLGHVKLGNRVIIRERDIVEFVERATRPAVR
jgi:excisionase family DNA binding protein